MKFPALRLLLLTIGLFFTRLGDYALMDVDEPRNAGCAAEMFARHDLIVPTFNAELRTHKPALTYWLMMSAYAGWGVSAFSARVWSAVLGIGTVLLTYGMGRRLFDAETGFWAGVALASAVFFAVAARIATPDAPLIFCVTLTMWVFVRTAFPRSAGDATAAAAPAPEDRHAGSHFPRSILAAIALYAAMGLAVLAKGPVGCVLPTAILGLYLLLVRSPARPEPVRPLPGWGHRLRTWLRPFAPRHVLTTIVSLRPLTAVVVIGAVAGPWFWAVHRATDGAWTQGFFLTHNLERATRAMEGHGGPALLYYPVVLCAAFFPWSCLLIPAVRETWTRIARGDAARDRLIFLSCWAGGWIGAFSLARTKLPSYITPAYPALALLVAVTVVGWLRRPAPDAARAVGTQTGPALRGSFVALIIAGGLAAIGLGGAAQVMFGADAWIGGLGLVPVLGGGLGLRWLARGERRRALVALGSAGVIFTFGALDGVLPYLSQRHQHGPELLEVAARRLGAGAAPGRLVAYGALEPSFVFNARHPIPLFARDDLAGLLAALDEPDTLILARDRDAANLRPRLPADVVELAAVPYFGRPDLRIVLLGRASAAAAETLRSQP